MDIKVENYTKVIKGNKVLDNVSISLSGGKIYGFEGVNGSGKTMLMKAIAGLIKPTEGKVVVNEKVVGKDISFPENMGILIENPAFIGKYTGLKNLQILASIQNKITNDDIRKTLEGVGLDPDDKRIYKKYSLGMKQRLGIACALMENPDFVLLDEPFNALDQSGVDMIQKAIFNLKQRGKLIILSCHDKTELEKLSDIIFYVENGAVSNR